MRTRFGMKTKKCLQKNNKDSPNEQLAGQAEAPRQRPEWPDPDNI